jgi:hypothetical protein
MKSVLCDTVLALALCLGLFAPSAAAAQDGTNLTKPAIPHNLVPFVGFQMNLPSIDWKNRTIRRETIYKVWPRSVAYGAGLRSGDAIVAVNGRAVVDMQPIELTTFFDRRPPKGGTFDYRLVIERGIFRRKIIIAFTLWNKGDNLGQSETPDSQVDLESSDGGWGHAVGGIDHLPLHSVIFSFETYKCWADDPNLQLYRVTPGSPSETGHDDLAWRIPYHEPFQHTVPTFPKLRPTDWKKVAKLTDALIAELGAK